MKRNDSFNLRAEILNIHPEFKVSIYYNGDENDLRYLVSIMKEYKIMMYDLNKIFKKYGVEITSVRSLKDGYVMVSVI